MNRFLMIDVGAGTMDVLYYDRAADASFKAVVKSPVRSVAETIARTAGNLVVTGVEMGGGPVTDVLKERAGQAQVVMSRTAAATLHHDIDKVTGWGINVVSRKEAEALRSHPDYTAITVGDIDIQRLESIISGLGVPFRFDVVGICAQDHGVPPAGTSHLEYRHQLFKAVLDRTPMPHSLLYEQAGIPETLNRLRGIGQTASGLPADEIYVMDSGMAAILGASMDALADTQSRFIVLDVATSHTIAAAMAGDELAGFFEYHTRDISCRRLDQLLPQLTEGRLTHRMILDEGGHGAYIRKSFPFADTRLILATGPKRRLVDNSRLPITFAAPWGDNMMTGCVGLLEAIRRRKGLEPIRYI